MRMLYFRQNQLNSPINSAWFQTNCNVNKTDLEEMKMINLKVNINLIVEALPYRYPVKNLLVQDIFGTF